MKTASNEWLCVSHAPIYVHSSPEWTGFICPVNPEYQSRMNRVFQKQNVCPMSIYGHFSPEWTGFIKNKMSVTSCPYMVISVQNEQVLSVPYVQNISPEWIGFFKKQNVCPMSIYGHFSSEWTGFICPVRPEYVCSVPPGLMNGYFEDWSSFTW